MILNIVSLVASIVAILVSVTALRQAQRQTQIMERQEKQRQHDLQDVMEWSQKFDEAVRLVQLIWPKTFIEGGARAYTELFPGNELRTQIENYLIDADLGRNRVQARSISPDLLLMPVVQRTIQDVLDRIAKFRLTDPVRATRIGLN